MRGHMDTMSHSNQTFCGWSWPKEMDRKTRRNETVELGLQARDGGLSQWSRHAN